MARSALGKEVNMSALASRNENVRAVGNMRVNARGDLVDSNNNIITNANQRVKSNYNHTVDDIGLEPTVAGNEMHNSGLTVDPIHHVEETQLTAEEQELFNSDDEDIQK
jgi:hypothetical protein